MKKILIVLALVLSSGIFTGCMEEEVTPLDEVPTSDRPTDNGI